MFAEDFIDEEVLRLQLIDAKTAFADNKPSVYLIKGEYYGYSEKAGADLKKITMAQVKKYVDGAFDGKVSQDKVDVTTTIVVGPDHWDKELPSEFLKYEKNLVFLPIHMVIHHKLKSKKELAKLKAPKNARKYIADGLLTKKLSEADMLLSLTGSSHAYKTSIELTPDDDFVEDLRNFNFNGQNVAVSSKSARRRKNNNNFKLSRKKSSSKKRSTKKSKSRKRNPKKNSSKKVGQTKKRTKIPSAKKSRRSSSKGNANVSPNQMKNFQSTMKAFKRNISR